LAGYVDLDDKAIGAYLTMYGTQVGNKYTAKIDNGVELGLDMFLAKGSARIFGRDSEIRVGYSLTAGVGMFSKTFSDEVELFDY